MMLSLRAALVFCLGLSMAVAAVVGPIEDKKEEPAALTLPDQTGEGVLTEKELNLFRTLDRVSANMTQEERDLLDDLIDTAKGCEDEEDYDIDTSPKNDCGCNVKCKNGECSCPNRGSKCKCTFWGNRANCKCR